MTTTTDQEPILVACCGQVMAGDDAFGLRVVQVLQRLKLPDTKIIELADRPSDLLDYLPGPRMLVVVDAVQEPSGTVGQLVEADWFGDARPRLAQEAAISSHGTSIADQIDLAERLGICPPQVWLVGCTIGHVRIGQTMLEVVSEQVPRAARCVVALVERFIAQQAGAGSRIVAE